VIGEELLAALDEATVALQAAADTARRAYTAENFDESQVRRERGRFAHKDSAETAPADETVSDPVARAAAAVDRIRTALPGVDVKVSKAVEEAVARQATKVSAGGKFASQGSVVDAMEGAATAFEAMGAKYDGVARGLGTVMLGETKGRNTLGTYEYYGSDRTIGMGDSLRNMPEMRINIRALTAEANTNRFINDPEYNTIPAERGQADVARLAEGVVTHEFGHAVDYAMPADRLDVGHGDAVAFSNATDGHVSRYSMNSQREYFAEVFAANELGYVDRLTDEDLEVLASAGVHPGTRAAAVVEVEDPPPDTFEGSIIWEYAAQDPRTAAFDESKVRRDRGRFTFKETEPDAVTVDAVSPWADEQRELRPAPRSETRARWASEDQVRVRLAASFPNARIEGLPQGWRDTVDEQMEWAEGNLTPEEIEEERGVAEELADRVVGVYEGLEQIADQFPDVAQRVTLIDMHGPLLDSGGDAETFMGPDKVDMHFSLSSILNADHSNFTIAGQEAAAQGDMRHWAFGVALHEFGHVMDSYAATVEHGAEFTSDDYMAYKFHQSNAPAMLAAWETEFPDHFDLAAGELSAYAMTEPAEYAAEAFAKSRLAPGELDDDAREVVEWMEARAGMQVGNEIAVAASTGPYTGPDGEPGIKIVDMLKGDCVPVRYALGLLGQQPNTASVARRAYSEDQPREHGRFAKSEGVSTETLRNELPLWGASFDGSRGITGEAARILGVRGYDPAAPAIAAEARRDAESILGRVNDAPPNPEILYSGHPAAAMSVGDRFDIPLAAATTSPRDAKLFGGLNMENPGVLLQIEPGAKAVLYREDAASDEWLTSGSFEVTSVGESAQFTPTVVGVRQLGTYDPRDPSSRAGAIAAGGGEILREIPDKFIGEARRAYAPDQVRDERGRFGLGGGTSDKVNVKDEFKKSLKTEDRKGPKYGMGRDDPVMDTSPKNAPGMRKSDEVLWARGAPKPYVGDNGGQYGRPNEYMISAAADKMGLDVPGAVDWTKGRPAYDEGRAVPPERIERAAGNLLKSIANGAPEQPVLWRGIQPPEDRYKRTSYGGYLPDKSKPREPGISDWRPKAGDVVRLPPMSFSRSATTAGMYGNEAVIRVREGATGYAVRNEYPWDAEVITAGTFLVHGSQRVGGTTYIDMEQVDTP
jgi:hypothetical protein